MERFDRELIPPWAIIWLQSYKRWSIGKTHTCGVCGILAMGDMCGGIDNRDPIFLIFEDFF